MRKIILIALGWLIAGDFTSAPVAAATITATATRALTPTPIFAPTFTITAARRVTVTATITPTATPLAQPTARANLALDPRALALDTLRGRAYGGGQIKITQLVADEIAFQRVLIEYPSDGLKITGMMNIPRGAPPFPVVILNHGYFKPGEYKTGDGTQRAADEFARRGYLTIAPDYRCYAGSQCASNPLYIGYAVDVLNVIASLWGLPYADATRVGVWGHSMGGQVTLRALAINDSIKVAALYGALTGDDETHYCWLYGCRAPLVTPAPRSEPAFGQLIPEFLEGIPTPRAPADRNALLSDIFKRSSPARFLRYVTTPIILHHGEKDDIVPLAWSVELSDALTGLNKPVALYTYPNGGHVFVGWDWQLFMTRTLAYFDEYLKPREIPITVERRVLRQERIALESSY